LARPSARGPVVRKDQAGEAGDCAPGKEHQALALGEQGARREAELLGGRGVVVGEAPAAQVQVGPRIEEFDELALAAVGPVAAGHHIDGIAAVVQAVAEAAVVGEKRDGKTSGGCPAKEHPVSARGQAGAGGELEQDPRGGVVVPQPPALQGQGVGCGVVQFDKLISVGVATPSPLVSPARSLGRSARISETRMAPKKGCGRADAAV